MICRICSNNISPFMSFGKMPIANGFLKEIDFKNEYFFEMKTAFCNSCFTFQLVDQPDPSMMFHENYAFYSRTSNFMVNHFNETADEIIEILEEDFSKDNDKFVVEIGSNDGVMLEHIVKKGIDCLGVEPSENVAKYQISMALKL